MALRVLLTGATGFLGGHLVDALRARGHAVRALARASSVTDTIEARGVEVRRGSFARPDSLRAAARGVDAVIHAAGGGIARRPADVYRANAASTEALAAAALARGVPRFLLVSSLAAHGPSGLDAPATEDDPDAPRSRYGRSKLAAERALEPYVGQMAITALRPPALYGPGERRMVPLFRGARRGWVPTVHPHGSLSLLHGADCAEAIVRALESDTGLGRLYLAEPAPYTRRRMAELVGEAVERDVRVVAVPPALLRVLGAGAELAGRLVDRPVLLSRDKVEDLGQPHQACDPSRAMAALGWRPTRDFASGAREAYVDYRRRGWL